MAERCLDLEFVNRQSVKITRELCQQQFLRAPDSDANCRLDVKKALLRVFLWKKIDRYLFL